MVHPGIARFVLVFSHKARWGNVSDAGHVYGFLFSVPPEKPVFSGGGKALPLTATEKRNP
jgi:hypothetical protein